MFKRLIITVLYIMLLPASVFTQEKTEDDHLRSVVNKSGQATVKIQYPGTTEVKELASAVSISSVHGDDCVIVLSPLTVEWFISRDYDYKIITDDAVKGIVMASDMKRAMEWDSYPTYDQYDSIMRSYSELYQSLCYLDTIGTTNYGKLVLVLKISDNVYDDEDEPEVFYTSTMHGDETGGFILMLRLAEYLMENYEYNETVRNLVDNLEIWINPLANPDGTYRTGNTISSPIRFNANGFDLNRNFPDPVDDDPVKQVETIDMMNFLKGHNFTLSANFHAGEEVVNYPWDRWERRHPDDEWFYRISRIYADTVHAHSVPGYMTFMENGVTNGWDWYDVYGGRQDYVTYDLQGREVTIELDDTKLTPAASLNTLWEYNRRSLLAYLGNALYGIHGKVTSSITGEPLPAKVFIPDHDTDTDNSHIYSDTLTGNFVRLTAAGTWPLQFTAQGYKSKIVNVMVENDVRVQIDVEMEPLTNPVDTTPISVLFLYPNPANEFIKIVLPPRQTGVIKVVIFNSVGQKLMDYTESTYEDIPLNINVAGLPGGVYFISLTNRETKVTDRAKFVVTHQN